VRADPSEAIALLARVRVIPFFMVVPQLKKFLDLLGSFQREHLNGCVERPKFCKNS
jgi:hypothetical protein